MPPKTARLQEEVEAQRARAAALQYLAKTGAGPSQKEIAQQQRDREKWTNNTSSAIQQRLARATQASAPSGYSAPTKDNTLEALAALRAKQRLLEGGAGDVRDDGYGGHHVEAAWNTASIPPLRNDSTDDTLPSGWKATVDLVSGETYYWSETTKETSWDRPKARKAVAEPKQGESEEMDEQLEDNWEEVTDPQSSAVYYWNRQTDETSWTKPVKKTVSLERAKEAKSKLDAILKSIGNGSTAPSTKRPASPSAARDNQASPKARKLK